MGTAPAFNIIVEVDRSTGAELAELVAEEFDEFEKEGDIDYRYEVPDSLDSGRMSTSNDKVRMCYIEGRDEYLGVGGGKRLLIHYSPYHWEEMETLRAKLEFLDKVEAFLQEHVSELTDGTSVDYAVSGCTI